MKPSKLRNSLPPPPKPGKSPSIALRLFERAYFSSNRWNRKHLPAGKALLLAMMFALVVSADPAKDSARFLLPCLACMMLFSGLANRASRPKVALRRILPDRVCCGETFFYDIEITNLGTRPLLNVELADESWIDFPREEDMLAPCPFDHLLSAFDRRVQYPKWLWLANEGKHVVAQEHAIGRLEPGQTLKLRTSACCPRRGLKNFLGMRISRACPLLLTRSVWFAPLAQSLVAWPEPLAPGFPVPQGRRSDLPGESAQPNKSADSEEFRSLREWRNGDNPRRIDWKATARSGSPVVREYAPEYHLRLAIALDASCLGGGCHAPGSKGAFEIALRTAAGYLMQADTKESKVSLLFSLGSPGAQCIELEDGPNSLNAAMDALAVQQPADSPEAFKDFSGELLRRAPAMSSLVYLCPRLTAQAGSLIDALRKAGVEAAVIETASEREP